MNKDTLQTQWPQLRLILKEQFSYLTEDDIDQINGRYDQLVAKLQQKYGYSREEAEERIRSWNFDRFATSDTRGEVIRENRANREYAKREESNFIPWLLGLGVPLLLLATYFLSSPLTTTTAPVADTTPVVQERVVTETQADRFISDGLRSALISDTSIASEMQNILISTTDGIVTLSGTAPSTDVRDFAVATSKDFAGVRQVIDNIQIK